MSYQVPKNILWAYGIPFLLPTSPIPVHFYINDHNYSLESEKAEITISQQGSTSSSVTSSIANGNQTVLRGNEVALSPSCSDYAEGLHAYFQAKPISFRRSTSISESYEEGFETDVSNIIYLARFIEILKCDANI